MFCSSRIAMEHASTSTEHGHSNRGIKLPMEEPNQTICYPYSISHRGMSCMLQPADHELLQLCLKKPYSTMRPPNSGTGRTFEFGTVSAQYLHSLNPGS